MEQDIKDRMIKWLYSGERGASNNVMFAVLSGMGLRSKDNSFPYDPDDFRRCHLLLETFPEWRKDLYKMSAVSQTWANLVNHWDELTEMLTVSPERVRSGEMYKLMSSLRVKEDSKNEIVIQL